MGLGDRPDESQLYEWVHLPSLPTLRPPTPRGQNASPLARALCAWLERHPLWHGELPRVLLVDLDNLRADPVRWRARMAAVVQLARQADHVALSGQHGAVARALPHLEEFGEVARPVADGSDLADFVLLDAAAAVTAELAQVVVVSNDGIFADLADRWDVTVLSPGADALSDRLRDSASRVVDLAGLEADAR